MANLFDMATPLYIRLPDGSTRVMAEIFQHPEGLLYFDLYWDQGDPDQSIHLVMGEAEGDGPWKIGAAIVYVLGCQGTNPELAQAHEAWQSYRLQQADQFPPEPLIAAIARKYGALIDTTK